MPVTIALNGTELGLGKHGLIAHLAAAFAHTYDQDVLAVDLTCYDYLLNSYGGAQYNGPYLLETAEDKILDQFPTLLIHRTPKLHLLPATSPSMPLSGDYDPDLDAIWAPFVSSLQLYGEPYDLILLDTSPINTGYTGRACTLADLVLIPSGLNCDEVWHVDYLLSSLKIYKYQGQRPWQEWRIVLHENSVSWPSLPATFYTEYFSNLLKTRLFPPLPNITYSALELVLEMEARGVRRPPALPPISPPVPLYLNPKSPTESRYLQVADELLGIIENLEW